MLCQVCKISFKHLQDRLRERRQLGLFKDSQNTYMDSFLKKIEDEKHNPNTFYTGKMFIRQSSVTHFVY